MFALSFGEFFVVAALLLLRIGLPIALLVLGASALGRIMNGRAGAARDSERQAVRLMRSAGVLVGCVAGWLTATLHLNSATKDLGRGAMLAPVVFGACVLVAVAAGETLVRQPNPDGPRTADLRPRRVVDYLPRNLATAVSALAICTLAMLAITTATAVPDDLGRAGRSLGRLCPDGTGSFRSPYPGSFYSIPLLIGLVVVAVIAVIAARTVVLRPRGVLPRLDDDAARRRSLRAVTAGLGIAIAVPALGVCFFGGLATADQSCPAVSWLVARYVMIAVAVLAIVVAVWCLAVLSLPAPTRDAGQLPADR